MPFIYADSTDGVISATGSTYTAARHATTGSVSASSSNNLYAVRAASLSGRGGGLTYRFARSFFAFDVSSISSCTSVSLKLGGYSSAGAGGGIVVMRSDAFGHDGTSSLASGDYDAIVNWNGTDDMTGASKYSAAPGINPNAWSTNSYNTIPLSSTAENQINNNDYIVMCVVDYTYDYLKADPVDSGFGSGALANNVGLHFNEQAGNKKPYLDIVVTASGFGHDVNGVLAANIGKVNSVATASIGKINSVD